MKAKQAYYVLLGILLLVISGSVGAVVYANRWLKTRTANLVSQKTDTIKLQQERASYIRAKNLLNKYQTVDDTLQKIIPKSKDQANAISEMLVIAKDNDIVLNSIAFPSSDLGATTGATKTTTTTTPTTKTAQPATVTQGKPVEGISGILGIEVNISNIAKVNGSAIEGISYNQVINFLQDLERNRRIMQIKSVQIQPLKDSKSGTIIGYSLTLTVTIFVKP